MKYLSLFSGIEAATVAWHPLGWECVGVSEIEPFPCAVLAHHYPEVPNLGDVTKITEDDIKALGHIDIVVFGSPCQDLSVAGLRKGFTCESTDTLTRSGLFFVAMRIVAWARKHCGCRFALWENVPGAFSSSGGRDFATVVEHMAGLENVPVPPKGWGNEGVAAGSEGLVEWATLDAQWFGVAQRRRRVFALADFGNWPNRPPILLEPESLRGDSAPRREAREEVTPTIRSGAPNGSASHGQRSGDTRDELIVPVQTFDFQSSGEYGTGNVASTMSARDYKSAKDLAVTHTLRGEGFDASEDGTGLFVPAYSTKLHNTASNGAGKFYKEYTAGLDANSPPPAVAYGIRTANTSSNGWGIQEETTHTLDQAMGVAVAQPVAFAQNSRDEVRLMNGGAGHGARSGDSKDEYIVPVQYLGGVDYEGNGHTMDEPTGPLLKGSQSGGGHPLPAIAFHPTQDPISSADGSTHAMGCGSKGGCAMVAVALRGREGGATAELGDEVGNCLRASGGGGDKAHVRAPSIGWSEELTPSIELAGTIKRGGDSGRHDGVMIPTMQVRRLTPVECERLQGFPEIKKTVTITVFQHSNPNVCLSDQQSTNVLAALQSHKSPSNASPAAENVFPSNANAAELNLNAGQARSSEPVLVSVQIDLERQHLRLHSQGRLLLSASIADSSEWCRLPIQAEDFVQLSVALLACLEKTAPTGRAALHLNTSGSFPLMIGNWFASQSGREIEELASDAEKFMNAVKQCTTFITSEAGRNSQNCESNLQTLLCCVTTAISSFIPNEIRSASSYALSIEVSHGYTMIPWRKQQTSPDGPRYKALGNSMAVPVMAHIGRKIQEEVE